MIGTAILLSLSSLAAPPVDLRPVDLRPVDHWRSEIEQAATRFQLPPDWIARVMQVESGGRLVVDGRPIRSVKGAIGLMQIMPATWEMLRDRYRLGFDPDDPRDNIMAGAAYLRALYDRFGYPALFAAYNAGPARYQDFVWGRGALPPETRTYVRRVAGPTAMMPATTAEPEANGGWAKRPAARPEPLFFRRVGASGQSASTDGIACHADIGLWAVPPPCA